MKSLASFASLIALGMLAGAILITTTAGPQMQLDQANGLASGAAGFDFRSLLLGLVLGLFLANLARVPWAELPRRVITWLLGHERNFFYGSVAAVLVVILFYY